MARGAQVRSVDAVRDSRVVLDTFRTESLDALTALELDVRRNVDWLDDQKRYWAHAVRTCQDEVTLAKAALSQKQMVAHGDRVPDTTCEEEDLLRARRRLEHAEDHLSRCRRWDPQLQRAVDEFMGPMRSVGSLLEADLPKTISLIDRMLLALDAYLTESGAPPASTSPPPPLPRREFDDAFNDRPDQIEAVVSNTGRSVGGDWRSLVRRSSARTRRKAHCRDRAASRGIVASHRPLIGGMFADACRVLLIPILHNLI